MTFNRWVYNKTPPFLRKNVFEIFAAILCLSAAIPMWLAKLDSPSIEASLPVWLKFMWTSALTIGPILIIMGLIGQNITKFQSHPHWMRIEAYGLGFLTYMGSLYAFAVLITGGFRSAVAIVITLIFTITCFFRMVEVYVEVEKFLEDIGAKKNVEPH